MKIEKRTSDIVKKTSSQHVSIQLKEKENGNKVNCIDLS